MTAERTRRVEAERSMAALGDRLAGAEERCSELLVEKVQLEARLVALSKELVQQKSQSCEEVGQVRTALEQECQRWHDKVVEERSCARRHAARGARACEAEIHFEVEEQRIVHYLQAELHAQKTLKSDNNSYGRLEAERELCAARTELRHRNEAEEVLSLRLLAAEEEAECLKRASAASSSKDPSRVVAGQGGPIPLGGSALRRWSFSDSGNAALCRESSGTYSDAEDEEAAHGAQASRCSLSALVPPARDRGMACHGHGDGYDSDAPRTCALGVGARSVGAVGDNVADDLSLIAQQLRAGAEEPPLPWLRSGGGPRGGCATGAGRAGRTASAGGVAPATRTRMLPQGGRWA